MMQGNSPQRQTRARTRARVQRAHCRSLPAQQDNPSVVSSQPRASLERTRKRRKLGSEPPQLLTPATSFGRKQELPTDGDSRHLREAKLTKSNLRSVQAESSFELPHALDEWREIVERPSTPPSNYLGQMANGNKSTKSGKSGKSSKTKNTSTTDGGLRNNPFGFAAAMRESFGVVQFNFCPPSYPATQKQLGIVAADLPTNYDKIQQTLTRDRDDLPSFEQFRQYCDTYYDTALSPDEAEIDKMFGLFIADAAWKRGNHTHGRKTLVVPPGMLPPQQNAIKPDMMFGICSRTLGKHSWIPKHLPGYVRNRPLICVNGVVEYKSGEGNIAAGRIQNQAAAQLLCNAWLDDERTLASIGALSSKNAPQSQQQKGTRKANPYEAGIGPAIEKSSPPEDRVIGKAFVGSVCFDGNVVEASVHWLAESVTSDAREHDCFSLRVAAGPTFAANLQEYQETYKKIANFRDWLFEVGERRVKEIKEMPTSEPEAIMRPEPEYDTSDSDSEDGNNDDESVVPEQSTSNSQSMQQMSLHAFDGSGGAPAGSAARPQAQKDPKKRRNITNTFSSAAHSAAKKLKQRKT